MNHPLAIHRSVAVNALRVYASECFLGDRISSEQTSKIMTKMCQFILTGPEFSVESFRSPVTTWQSCMTLGSHTASHSLSLHLVPKITFSSDACIYSCKTCTTVLCHGSRECNLGCQWPPMQMATSNETVLSGRHKA